MSDSDSIDCAARRSHTVSKRNKGIALVVVLWVVASAALLISSFNAIIRSHAKVTLAELVSVKLDAALDAGLELAVARLMDDNEAARWLPDGSPHAFQFGGHNLSITISDPNGLIDLNKAPKDILLNFLRQFTGSEDIAVRVRDGILHKRQLLSELSDQDLGGPSPFAFNASEASNRPQAGQPVTFSFIDKTQLRHVVGMNERLYRAIKPFMTVYSRDGAINPTTAPPQVMAAFLNGEESDVKSFSEYQLDDAAIDSGYPPAQRTTAKTNDEPGPTFIITITSKTKHRRRMMGKQFVITVGLDDLAPYRLISWRSLAPGD